jgi:hypothetical protein
MIDPYEAARPYYQAELAAGVVDQGADHVELGVNTSRHEAYAALAARGYRAGLVGVSMHQAKRRGLQPSRRLAHR